MYWCLLGVLVVIIGFAIKLEPIAIIVVSAIVTAIFGGINVIDLLETVGTTKELPVGAYAQINVDFKDPSGLTLAVAKAKNYFFNKWLPDSGYEVLPGIESYELYDRRSRIKLASMLLIFPLRKK